MIVIILILVLLLIFAALKWFTYNMATKGLLYYLGTKYKEDFDSLDMKSITQTAIDKTIKDFTSKRN